MRRSAYTLFEMICVMAVLVVAGFISLPMLKPILTSNNLQAASDMVRSRWTEMRTRAVAEGRSYRFAIVENTGKFRIAPDDPEFWGDGGNSTKSETPPWEMEDTLPGQVLFLNTESTGGQPANGSWTSALTFLPNGTAREDVQVSFGQASSRTLILRLRGATGTITEDR